MSELRWALLGAGILFLAALLAWEFTKRRRSARDAAAARAGATGASEGTGAWAPGPEAGTPGGPSSAREPIREPRVVEFDAPEGQEPALGELPIIDPGVAPARESISPHGDWSTQAAAPRSPALVLAWPPESDRVILALRVVPRAGERFTGASLRQALVGEGFQHGEFSIFHKPLGDGRVVLSAASLTRPGTFDMASMDLASFSGLNLFAVLPGPLAGREAFERLLASGRILSQRLRGDLLDQKGQPLEESRLDELRREAAGIPAA